MFPVVEIGPLTFFTHDIFTLLGLAAGFALYYRALRRDRILDRGSSSSAWPPSPAGRSALGS